MMEQAGHTENATGQWKILYRVGGTAALIAAIIFRRNLASEYMLFRGWVFSVPARAQYRSAPWIGLVCCIITG